MTNAERILRELRQHPGLTDAELRDRTGIQPHQQVNQICRRLAEAGALVRREGSDGRIVNVPVGDQTGSTSPDEQPQPHTEPAQPGSGPVRTPSSMLGQGLDRCLAIIPCSSAKRPGGDPFLEGRSIASHLPTALSHELQAARDAVASRADVDGSRLLPAYERYSGHFYGALDDTFVQAVEKNVPVLILSGGYGVVLPKEPIGSYDARFRRSWWPDRIVERSVAAYAAEVEAEIVVAFLSSSTEYAKVIRGVRWGDGVRKAHLLTPDNEGRGGAQRAVPRASGEAFDAFVRGELSEDWRSNEGLRIATETLK